MTDCSFLSWLSSRQVAWRGGHAQKPCAGIVASIDGEGCGLSMEPRCQQAAYISGEFPFRNCASLLLNASVNGPAHPRPG